MKTDVCDLKPQLSISQGNPQISQEHKGRFILMSKSSQRAKRAL
jgi:hypothetical protein